MVGIITCIIQLSHVKIIEMFNIASFIISSLHALQAYDDQIGHHRPAMRPMRAESL